MLSRQSLYLSVLALATTLAVGCQPAGPTVGSLPALRFSGPTIQPRATPAPPSAPGWQPKYIAGVPANWMPRSSPRPWKYIVIHHTATSSGSVASLDRAHKHNGWDGVGYHFVIGNGQGMGDGEVDPTPRWPVQKWGAHTKTANNEYNNFGIGICMVGNFDLTAPSQAQLRSVSKLVAHLMKTYNIPSTRVLGHGQCKPTDCPGRHTSIARIRQMAAQQMASSNPVFPTASARTAGSMELLHEAR